MMKALAVCLVVLFVSVSGVSSPVNVAASQGSLWSSGVSTVLKRTTVATGVDSSCPTYRQEVFVVEYGASRNACIDGNEHLKIGSYFEKGQYEGVVEFAYSNVAHVLRGACTERCRYSAETDTLVTEQPINQSNLGLVLFRHASSRIHRVSLSSGVGYTFDTTNPDYALKNDVGQYIATPTFGMSTNGKWLVVELRDKGTAIIDIATMSTRQITTDGYKYGYGMNPSEQLAVSDDGKSVAVMGSNAGYRVFDVVPGCGQDLVGDLGRISSATACPSSDSGIWSLFPNFAVAERPRFFGDGHELEVTVTSWVDGIQRITFATPGTPLTHQLKLLSLGDSFSSGEGETDGAYYVLGTNQTFDKCHVSIRAYSGVIAQKLEISDATAKNVACSGATIGDIIGSDDEYWGQGGRLGIAGLKLSIANRQIAKQEAVDTFRPGRAFQADFIKRYNPEVITIGIGGNDAGLMGKLGSCAMPGTCEWAQPDRLAATAAEIRRLYDSLGALFNQLSEIANGSRIFVVGYPETIDPEGSCGLVAGMLVNHTERVFIQNSIQYLNQIIHAAAHKAGLHYVDIEASFKGKQLCDTPPLAINEMRTGADISPIGTLPALKIIGAETFHPTPLGHALIADTFLENYPLLDVGATDTRVVSVEPSPYWHSDNAPTDRSQYATEFAFTRETDSWNMMIKVPSGTLQPFSTATVEIHSDPLRLETFVVNENGGIEGRVSIPRSVGDGFHTLHLLGVNRGGEAIDMYQFLTIGQQGEVMTTRSGDESQFSGDRDDSSGFDGKVLLSSAATDKGVLSGAGDVLGAQSIATLEANVQKGLLPDNLLPSLHTVLVKRLLFFGAVVVVIVSVVLFCVILLSRKWSKPGS